MYTTRVLPRVHTHDQTTDQETIHKQSQDPHKFPICAIRVSGIKEDFEINLDFNFVQGPRFN